MHGGSFVHDLAIVLGVAAVTGLLFRLINQPSILGYLLAGLIVGPALHAVGPERVHVLSEFGVVLVMFAVGLEFRVSKFLKVLPVSGVTGLIQIAILFWAGFTVGQEIGWSKTEALFLGACICISSTMVVSKILEQQPVPPGVRSLVFGVLVLQDVAAIALIAVMTAVAKGSGASLGGVLLILAKLVLVLVLIVALGMFVVPRFVRRLTSTRSTETLVVGAIGLCFATALLTESVGYSGALGAFIAGILVAESGRGHQVESSIAAVRDMFAAVFFVSVGMSVDLRVAYVTLPLAGLVLAVVVLSQLLAVSMGGILSGSGVRRSVTAGLALGQIGEFAFILAAIGTSRGVVRPELQAVLVTVAVLSTLTTSLTLKYRNFIVEAVDHALPARMRHLLSLYEVWFEELRARRATEKSAFRQGIRAILLDVFAIVVCLVIWRLWSKDIGHFLAELLRQPQGHELFLANVSSGLLVTPFVLALLLTARSLTLRAAERVFAGEPSPAAHALLRGAVGLLILLALGPLIALLFKAGLGFETVWPILLGLFVLSAFLVWRRAGQLDQDILSHGEVLLRAIAKQSLPDRPGHSEPPPAPGASLHHSPHDSITQIDIPRHSVLPGLTHMRDITLVLGSFAIDKTLIDLQLRTVTGASVLAIKKPDKTATIPQGKERLEQGDTLIVTGAHIDQDAAQAYLLTGTKPDALPDPDSDDDMDDDGDDGTSRSAQR